MRRDHQPLRSPRKGSGFPTPVNGVRVHCLINLHDLRIHDLRHSFASTLADNGARLYEVQKLLGHSRSATTERYAHLANHRLQQAVSLIDKAFD